MNSSNINENAETAPGAGLDEQKNGDDAPRAVAESATQTPVPPVMQNKEDYWRGFNTNPWVYMIGLSAIGVMGILFTALFLLL